MCQKGFLELQKLTIPPLHFAVQMLLQDQDSGCQGCPASTLKREFRRDLWQEHLLVRQKGRDLWGDDCPWHFLAWEAANEPWMIWNTHEGMSCVRMMGGWRTKCSADGGKIRSLLLAHRWQAWRSGINISLPEWNWHLWSIKCRKDAVILPRILILRAEISESQHKASESSAWAFFISRVFPSEVSVKYVVWEEGMWQTSRGWCRMSKDTELIALELVSSENAEPASSVCLGCSLHYKKRDVVTLSSFMESLLETDISVPCRKPTHIEGAMPWRW